MQPEFVSLGERAGAALKVWQAAYADIQGAGVGVEQPNGLTPSVEIKDIDFRVTAGLSALSRLRGASREQLELIANRLPNLKTATETIEATAIAISGTLGQWQGASASDQNGNLNLQLSLEEKGSANYDLGNPLAAINQHVATLLDALPYIAQAAGDDTVSLFGELASAANNHFAEAKTSARAALAKLKTSTKVVDELNKLDEHVKQLAKQVEDTLTAATKTKDDIARDAAEVTQKLAQVREVSKDADTLQQRVDGFAAQFDAFDSQMKARLALFSEFESSTKEAQRINKQREGKIDELIANADTMIRGATTAGLSKSLEDTKDKYERRLTHTQWFFLGSVVFLLVSALPVAAQLIPGPWQQYFLPVANNATSESSRWFSTLGKLILVLPGTWATAFFASNYAELFHLSREYAHKAALAKAIDGFKREAPDYQQEIVGSVFMEIQENPGSRKAPSPATPQNPIVKRFLEKVLEAIKIKPATK